MLKKILNILARNWVILFLSWMTFIFLFTLYHELSLNWRIMIIIWTVIAVAARQGGFLRNVPVNLNKLWLVSVFVYPFIETFISFFITKNIIPYSWRPFNTAEHFFWMMFLLIISYPIFYKVLQKLNSLHKFLHLFGFLMVVGIFNEFFEFSLRMYHEISEARMAIFYKDTIYDLGINIPGVIAGMALVYFFEKRSKETTVFKKSNSEKIVDDAEIKKNYLPKFISNNKLFKLIKKLLENKWIKRLVVVGMIGFIFWLIVNFYIVKSTQDQIFYDQENLPKYQTALLLGAKVYDNEVLSFIMRDRADVAIEIYKLGKVDKILVSGDHGTNGYDEVNAIKNYLLKNGVDERDIFLDHAGFDTYDSVYRAKEIFGVESMIIVTQKFHLSRSIYIANSLGVESVGIVADRRYIFLRNYLRESLSRVKAFLNVNLNAKPKFLGERILITGDSRESWD